MSASLAGSNQEPIMLALTASLAKARAHGTHRVRKFVRLRQWKYLWTRYISVRGLVRQICSTSIERKAQIVLDQFSLVKTKLSNKIQYWCCVFDFSNVFFQMYHFSSILNKNFRISHSNTFVKILSILLRIDLFYLNKTADKAVLFHFTQKCIWSTQLCSIIENLLR